MKTIFRQRAVMGVLTLLATTLGMMTLFAGNQAQANMQPVFWFVEDYDDDIPYTLDNELDADFEQVPNFRSLHLSGVQRRRIAQIELEFNGRRRPLLQRMTLERDLLRARYFRGPKQDMIDAFEAMLATRRNVFALQLQLREQVLSVLTDSQRKALDAP